MPFGKNRGCYGAPKKSKTIDAPFPPKKECGFDFTQKIGIGETIIVESSTVSFSGSPLKTRIAIGDFLMILWAMAKSGRDLQPRPVVAQQFKLIEKDTATNTWHFKEIPHHVIRTRIETALAEAA